MRVISQDGRIDVPYEKATIVYVPILGKHTIGGTLLNKASVQLAEYSSEEKALKAMEMLREQYGKHYLSQGGVMATANFYAPPFGFIPPKVFQFPKDDEVEV